MDASTLTTSTKSSTPPPSESRSQASQAELKAEDVAVTCWNSLLAGELICLPLESVLSVLAVHGSTVGSAGVSETPTSDMESRLSSLSNFRLVMNKKISKRKSTNYESTTWSLEPVTPRKGCSGRGSGPTVKKARKQVTFQEESGEENSTAPVLTREDSTSEMYRLGCSARSYVESWPDWEPLGL